MNFIPAIVIALSLALTSCSKNDEDKPKGDTAKESVDKYVSTLTGAQESARKAARATEEKQRGEQESIDKLDSSDH